MPIVDLPSNLSYGTVTGRFLLAYADSTDGDLYPDGQAAKGSVFFKPSPAYLLDATATPDPVTVLPATVEATLDSEGYLCGYGTTRGIRLLATDDPSANPVDWTWEVSFRLTDQSDTPVNIDPYSFSLPSGSVVDLTSLAPVQDSNGTYYLVGPKGDTGPANTLTVGTVITGAPNSPALVEITGTAPNQVINITIPQGIQGEQGIQGIQGIQGETGPIGPTGATGIVWRGVWSNTTDYVNNDAVYYNNSSWFASGNPTVGEEPTLSAVHWFPLALQGATGPQGPQGIQGIQGIQGPPGSLDNLNATAPIVYNNSTSTLTFDPTYVTFINGGTA